MEYLCYDIKHELLTNRIPPDHKQFVLTFFAKLIFVMQPVTVLARAATAHITTTAYR